MQGLAWDPIGRYLASQGADDSTIIWKTADFTAQEVVTAPYDPDLQKEVFYRRASWSSDGIYLATSCGMANGQPVCHVLNRDKWESKFKFVGHVDNIIVSVSLLPPHPH